MMMLFKGVASSLAGPAPNYDMQKVLSTRSPPGRQQNERVRLDHPAAPSVIP